MKGKLPTGPSQCDFPVNMPIGREPQRAKHARGIELKQNIELQTISHTKNKSLCLNRDINPQAALEQTGTREVS